MRVVLDRCVLCLSRDLYIHTASLGGHIYTAGQGPMRWKDWSGSSVHLRGMERSVAQVFHARLSTFSAPIRPLCIPVPVRHVPPAQRVGPLRSRAVSARLLMSFDVVARPICAVFSSSEPQCLVPISGSPIRPPSDFGVSQPRTD